MALRASGGLQCGGATNSRHSGKGGTQQVIWNSEPGGHLEHRWLAVGGYLRVVGACMVVVWAQFFC